MLNYLLAGCTTYLAATPIAAAFVSAIAPANGFLSLAVVMSNPFVILGLGIVGAIAYELIKDLVAPSQREILEAIYHASPGY